MKNAKWLIAIALMFAILVLYAKGYSPNKKTNAVLHEKNNDIISAAAERAKEARALRESQGGKSTYFDRVENLPSGDHFIVAPAASYENSYDAGSVAKCKEAINDLTFEAEHSADVQDVKSRYGRSVKIYYTNGTIINISCSGRTLRKTIIK